MNDTKIREEIWAKLGLVPLRAPQVRGMVTMLTVEVTHGFVRTHGKSDAEIFRLERIREDMTACFPVLANGATLPDSLLETPVEKLGHHVDLIDVEELGIPVHKLTWDDTLPSPLHLPATAS